MSGTIVRAGIAAPAMSICIGCPEFPTCPRPALAGQRCLRCEQRCTPRPSMLRADERAHVNKAHPPGLVSQIVIGHDE